MAALGIETTFREQTVPCPTCGVPLRQSYVLSRWQPSVCTACQDRERDRANTARKAATLAERAADLRVPAMYAEVAPETWQTHGSAASQRACLRILLRGGLWLQAYDSRSVATVTAISVFTGPPGTGKNFWAWAIAKHVALVHGGRVSFSTFDDVVRDLRGMWGAGDGGATEAVRLTKYRNVDLLVLDEVSRHAVTAKGLQPHLYQLIAHREQRFLPTIVTTNETGADLVEMLGPPLMSRVTGWDGFWDFSAIDDYRLTHQAVR
jgi:DNA replication protein DnaC